MGSPITSWEGATAIFTGANNGTAIAAILLMSIVLTVVPIVETALHEAKLYRKHRNM